MYNCLGKAVLQRAFNKCNDGRHMRNGWFHPQDLASLKFYFSCLQGKVRYPVWPHTFVPPSADSDGAVVSYWRKYVHEVLVNH